jgi:hypothetical protein
MIYSLPYYVEIGNTRINIRNNCDFRVVLDAIAALNDEELDNHQKIVTALYIFYGEEELNKIVDFEEAARQMMIVINGGKEDDGEEEESKPVLMDWQHDFPQLVPPINKALGYDVRTPNKFTHWWTLLGGYSEIDGECTFANIMTIRNKRRKGKKLEKWEEEFYRENRKMIDLPMRMTKEEREFLDSDW